MKLFSLINSFLVLNNLSFGEASSNHTKKELFDVNNLNADNETSAQKINDEWKNLFKNQNFYTFKYLMNNVRWNYKKIKENEESQNDKILAITKTIKEKSLLSFKPDDRDNLLLYLNEISDLMDDFRLLFLYKKSYEYAIASPKFIRDKVFEFEDIGFLLPILIKFLEISKNENFLKLYIINEALRSMEERIKVLRGMFYGYWDLMINNLKIFTYDLNCFELRNKIKLIKAALLNNKNYDSDLANSLKNEILNFFTKFNECVEEEKHLSSFIFKEMDCIFRDYKAFKYLKN